MFRRAERPRVAGALTVLAVLVVVGLTAGGVVVGKASVDPASAHGRLDAITAGADATNREIKAVHADRDKRLQDLEAQRQSALTRARQWRTRAHRAERQLRARSAAAKRRAAAAKRRATSAAARRSAAARATTRRRTTPPPPPPPPAAIRRPPPPPPPPAGPTCAFPPC